MAYCLDCGQLIQRDAQSCAVCGRPVANPSRPAPTNADDGLVPSGFLPPRKTVEPRVVAPEVPQIRAAEPVPPKDPPPAAPLVPTIEPIASRADVITRTEGTPVRNETVPAAAEIVGKPAPKEPDDKAVDPPELPTEKTPTPWLKPAAKVGAAEPAPSVEKRPKVDPVPVRVPAPRVEHAVAVVRTVEEPLRPRSERAPEPLRTIPESWHHMDVAAKVLHLGIPVGIVGQFLPLFIYRSPALYLVLLGADSLSGRGVLAAGIVAWILNLFMHRTTHADTRRWLAQRLVISTSLFLACTLSQVYDALRSAQGYRNISTDSPLLGSRDINGSPSWGMYVMLVTVPAIVWALSRSFSRERIVR